MRFERPQTCLFLLIFIFFTTALALQAQESTDTTAVKPSYWKREIIGGINLNQATFSDNWRGGGVNSVAVGLTLSGKALYEKGKVTWVNELQTQLGFLQQGANQEDFRKNNDRLYLDSKLGYGVSSKWNLFASTNFLSQFIKGYTYSGTDPVVATKISDFFAPAFLTHTFGAEYKPASYFWVRFGVGGFRQTFVVDQSFYEGGVEKVFGVNKGDIVRNELGLNLLANFDKNIAENVNLKLMYLMFANYHTAIKSSDNINHRIDLTLTAKINSFMNVNLTAVALYNNDMAAKMQFAQTLSLGVAYKFSEF
jgi:hypothetical protein